MKIRTAVIHREAEVNLLCIACGCHLGAVTEIGLEGGTQRHGPTAGALTCCGYCGQILAFDEQLQLRFLAPQEIEERRHSTAYRLLSSMSLDIRHGRGPYGRWPQEGRVQ